MHKSRAYTQLASNSTNKNSGSGSGRDPWALFPVLTGAIVSGAY